MLEKQKKPKKLLPRKTRKDAIPDEVIGKALKATDGRLYHAAEKLGLAGSSVALRVGQSPYLQEIRDEALQRRIDRMEQSLDELVLEKNLGAICFGLKTLGKQRGYTEHVPIFVPKEIAQGFEQTMRLIADAQEARKIEEINVIKS
jgi:hypothetical protein